MRGFIKAIVLSATVALVCAPRLVRADGYVNPWAGVNFRQRVLEHARAGFGVNAGGMGAGVIGGEVSLRLQPELLRRLRPTSAATTNSISWAT